MLKSYMDVRAEFESYLTGIGVQISPHEGICAISPTGEPYLSFGDDDKARSIEDAEKCLLATLKLYACCTHGTLYWREYPQITPSKRGAFYRGYGRLLISDKPVIHTTQRLASNAP